MRWSPPNKLLTSGSSGQKSTEACSRLEKSNGYQNKKHWRRKSCKLTDKDDRSHAATANSDRRSHMKATHTTREVISQWQNNESIAKAVGLIQSSSASVNVEQCRNALAAMGLESGLPGLQLQNNHCTPQLHNTYRHYWCTESYQTNDSKCSRMKMRQHSHQVETSRGQRAYVSQRRAASVQKAIQPLILIVVWHGQWSWIIDLWQVWARKKQIYHDFQAHLLRVSCLGKLPIMLQSTNRKNSGCIRICWSIMSFHWFSFCTKKR